MLKRCWDRVSEFMEKHAVYCAACLLVLAVLCRIIFWYCNPIAGRDEIYYIDMAIHKNLLKGLQSHQPPLMQRVLSCWLSLWCPASMEGVLFCTRMLAMILGGAGVIPYFFIGRKVCGRNIYGLLAMLIAAVHPSLVESSVIFIRETCALPLVALVVLLCIRMIGKPSWKDAVAAGALVGIGELCRYEFAEWSIFCSAAIILGVVFERRILLQTLRKIAFHVSLHLACAFAVWVVGGLLCGVGVGELIQLTKKIYWVVK